LRRLL